MIALVVKENTVQHRIHQIYNIKRASSILIIEIAKGLLLDRVEIVKAVTLDIRAQEYSTLTTISKRGL